MSDIIKALKNIKNQLDILEEVDDAQPEKIITSPLITCQKNISNSDQQKLIMELRRQIKELKLVNSNQRFVFMNKVDELKRVNHYLKEELFQSKEDQIEVKREARTNLILSQMRFTPQEHNGVMSNYHTNFNPNKTTCFICNEEKYSYTRICCGMGICFDCFLNNYQKKLERRVEGVQLVIGYDCPACGQRVSNSPEAIDPSLREIRWGNDDDEGMVINN